LKYSHLRHSHHCAQLLVGTSVKASWANNTPAHQLPGEVVTVRVSNLLENGDSKGNVRPGVLAERFEGHFEVVGLNRNSTYGDGRDARNPIPNRVAIGPTGAGFLWGSVTKVGAIDIYEHIDYCDPSLAFQIRMSFNLRPEIADGIDRNSFARHGNGFVG